MLKDYLPWIIAGLVVLALVIGGLVLTRVVPEVAATRRRRPRPPRDHFRNGDEAPAPHTRAGVVVTPTKDADVPAVRDRITAACLANGWGEPLFYETTVEDPGQGQAAQAVRDGADIVCTLGGDGTVRNVASALVGTETALASCPPAPATCWPATSTCPSPSRRPSPSPSRAATGASTSASSSSGRRRWTTPPTSPATPRRTTSSS